MSEKCIEKQEEIYRLREKIQQLNAKISYQERKATEGYFGSSTPSKKPVKKNSETNGAEKKRGGGKVDHKGNGRQSISAKQADRVEAVDVGSCCPTCGTDDLTHLERRERTVIEYITEKKLFINWSGAGVMDAVQLFKPKRPVSWRKTC